jgi:hypothetical protein
MGQFSAVNRASTFVWERSQKQKLDDLARQKGSWLEVCCSLLALHGQGAAARFVVSSAGGFSTAWRPGKAITQPVAKILAAPLPIWLPRKMLIHPFSFPYPSMNRSARPQRDKSIFQISLPPASSTHTHTHEARRTAVSTAVEYKSSPAPLLPGFCPHLPYHSLPAARDSSIQSTSHSRGGRGTAAAEE